MSDIVLIFSFKIYFLLNLIIIFDIDLAIRTFTNKSQLDMITNQAIRTEIINFFIESMHDKDNDKKTLDIKDEQVELVICLDD